MLQCKSNIKNTLYMAKLTGCHDANVRLKRQSKRQTLRSILRRNSSRHHSQPTVTDIPQNRHCLIRYELHRYCCSAANLDHCCGGNSPPTQLQTRLSFLFLKIKYAIGMINRRFNVHSKLAGKLVAPTGF